MLEVRPLEEWMLEEVFLEEVKCDSPEEWKTQLQEMLIHHWEIERSQQERRWEGVVGLYLPSCRFSHARLETEEGTYVYTSIHTYVL